MPKLRSSRTVSSKLLLATWTVLVSLSLLLGATDTNITFRHNAKVHQKERLMPQLFSGMPSLVPVGQNSKQYPKQSVFCTLSYGQTLSETVTSQNLHSVVLTLLLKDE